MSQRAHTLHTTADTQIGELIDLIEAADEPAWHRPCPGREKLGDGTIGANAAHTAANYERIGAFVATAKSMSARHQVPGFLRALGHTPPDHGGPGPGVGDHDQPYSAEDAHPGEIVARLAAARQSLGAVAELTDRQLDAIPPKDSFRFCDGDRTLEQVLAALLKHQGHQLQALRTALTVTL